MSDCLAQHVFDGLPRKCQYRGSHSGAHRWDDRPFGAFVVWTEERATHELRTQERLPMFGHWSAAHPGREHGGLAVNCLECQREANSHPETSSAPETGIAAAEQRRARPIDLSAMQEAHLLGRHDTAMDVDCVDCYRDQDARRKQRETNAAAELAVGRMRDDHRSGVHRHTFVLNCALCVEREAETQSQIRQPRYEYAIAGSPSMRFTCDRPHPHGGKHEAAVAGGARLSWKVTE